MKRVGYNMYTGIVIFSLVDIYKYMSYFHTMLSSNNACMIQVISRDRVA